MSTETAVLEDARTIVVGGGLAGLAAATYLARGGRRVTLLEKTPTSGGRAVTDTHAGYALNRGAHAFYTGGAASDVLRELGVTYASGMPKRIFAMDERGLHAFPADAVSLLRTTLLSATEKFELMQIFIRIGALDPAQFARQSVADYLSATTTSPRVHALLAATARVNLYSTALDLASADTFISRIQQTLKHPVHYVEGGWQSLVTGLEHAARAAGVEVLTSCSVAAVDVRDAQATGVRLHDGMHIGADAVVLAVPPPDALRVLESSPAGDTLRDASTQSTPVALACLDLALSHLPSPAHPIVFRLDQPHFATAQSEFTRLAPEGGAVMHTMKQLDPRVPNDPHQDRAALESFVDMIQPGWREVVVERRFFPHIAAAGMLPLASHGGLAGRPAHQSDVVPNLYFAGDWVGPDGWLVDASLSSARDVARSILDRRLRTPVRRGVTSVKAA